MYGMSSVQPACNRITPSAPWGRRTYHTLPHRYCAVSVAVLHWKWFQESKVRQPVHHGSVHDQRAHTAPCPTLELAVE
jgi:hypothetical protein